MTFDDIVMSEAEYKGALRIWEQLEELARDCPPERAHWGQAFRMLMRIHRAQTAEQTVPFSVEDVISDEDRAALVTLRPELQRLLSTVWQHGQWKLGELHAWERVWLFLRHLDGVLHLEEGANDGN